jgi:hypothetical protein
LYEPAPGLLQSLAQMPEWYLIVLCLAAISLGGFLWAPLLAFAPLCAGAALLPLFQAFLGGLRAKFPGASPGLASRFRLVMLTTLLFAVQPVARLRGRLGHGLTPWRRHNLARPVAPVVWKRLLWSDRWRQPEEWLKDFERFVLREAVAMRGGDFDPWDLYIRGGLAGGARIHLAVEEHGAGRQLLRWQVKSTPGAVTALVVIVMVAISLAATHAGSGAAALSCSAFALGLLIWSYSDCSAACGIALAALKAIERSENETA